MDKSLFIKRRTSKLRINPLEYLAANSIFPEHIVFDPKAKPQYHIIRQSTHDGTLIFSHELIRKALRPLLGRLCFWAEEEPSDEEIQHVVYTVGWIRDVAVFKKQVDLPCGRFPGVIERVSLGVSCSYPHLVKEYRL